MSVIGLALMTAVCGMPREGEAEMRPASCEGLKVDWRKPVFVSILFFCLIIPSDWTQDIPDRYGKRHPGLVHSALYPRLAQ
jgi:hypothetical protein